MTSYSRSRLQASVVGVMAATIAAMAACGRPSPSRHATDGSADVGVPADVGVDDADVGAEAGLGDADDRDADVLGPSFDCAHAVVQESCLDGMCRIPAGCFVMGSPRDEPFSGAISDQQVLVELTYDFEVGQTEVTRAQWLAVGLPEPRVDWRRTGSSDANVPPEGFALCTDPQCPVTWVGYDDAMAYANLLSEQRGLAPCYVFNDCENAPGGFFRCQSVRVSAPSVYECEGYRLPTQAEWEYATRAGTSTAYYSGPISSDLDVGYNCGIDPSLNAIGWYCGNSGASLTEWRLHPVAQKQANAWGLYDCSGNAWEWTNDLYDPLGYGAGPLTNPITAIVDPTNLTPTEHPHYGAYAEIDGYPGWRVIRGGAFDQVSGLAKSGRHLHLGAAGQSTGFRIVRTLSQ